MMSEQGDVILTPCSYGDGELKPSLDGLLWGYPKLVDACPFSVLADVRKQKLEEWEEIDKPLPAIHSELATDAPGGKHTELPGGGDITRDPSLSHSPPHENRASMDEHAHSDVHGVYSFEAENHPGENPLQTTTQGGSVSQ